MIRKLARWLTGRPKFIITVALLLLIPSLVGFVATRVNYDVLSYLPEDVRSVEGEHLLEEPFHAAATSMVIIEGMPADYTNRLLNDIRRMEHVSNAFWVSNSVGIQVPVDMFPSKLRENFYSGDATMMIVQFDKPLSSAETMDSIVLLRKMINERCFVAGMSGMVEDIKELVIRELPVYSVIAVVLTLAVLLLTFDAVIMPFLFLACIGLAIAYNMGTNIILGEVSYVTRAIAMILQLGVTMDYSIFLYHRYLEEKTRHDDIRDAMAEAMTTAFSSLSGSSLTTIAGFLSLCAMRFTLGRDMGLVMAKGVVLGILSVILILPSFILVLDDKIGKWKHKDIFPDFTGFNRWLLKHRAVWIVLFLLLLAPAYYMQSHTRMYYQISRSLPDTLPAKIANEKLKEDFGIATQTVIIVREDLDNGSLREMEDRLEAVPGISHVISLHSMLGDGIPEFFLPAKIRDIFVSDEYQLIMLTSDFDPATDETMKQLREVSAIVAEYDDNAYITGEAAMTEDLREVFDKDYRVTSILSMAAIFVIVAFVFRSLSVPFALIQAIELAIWINLGICWFNGKQVSFIAPTIISSIQLGATVDYAILITTRFQEEIRNGRDRMEAAVLAGTASDVSIITSSFVMLSANLGVTLVSKLKLIQEMCLLLARGAMISAFITIFMVPCLLYMLEPLFRRTTFNWDGSKAGKIRPPEKQAAVSGEGGSRELPE